jgi:hypothetical protein
LTSDEGKRLAAEKETEWAAKAQKQKDAEIRRKQQAAEREQQRHDRPADQPFTGALSSKKKPDLQEIAGALNLTETGTKEALISRINKFFEQNPDLHDAPRFLGLFNRASKRQLKIHHPTFQTCSTFTEIHANHLQQTF